MSTAAVVVPIKLSLADIQLLAESREDDAIEGSPLAEIIERILQRTAAVTERLEHTASALKYANPYATHSRRSNATKNILINGVLTYEQF